MCIASDEHPARTVQRVCVCVLYLFNIVYIIKYSKVRLYMTMGSSGRRRTVTRDLAVDVDVFSTIGRNDPR
jgi:hypothetical protein